ncbi:hypothetical protein [Streptomyces luteogriseus]|uniref:hypothetical protein n=1 Tax=Streptomyces luteogriseus TaxID=68233 RepID=UPI00261D9429|nr:hypothetical protein [Streptomyces luteogriseus]WTJ32783.1 hypothetical protein OID52_39955 [Streptomyces luteogriseus]
MTRTPDAVHQALHEEVTAAEAAASPRAREVLLAATEALACTAADVLLSGEPRDEAWARHRTV